jgi:hypothetical protein
MSDDRSQMIAALKAHVVPELRRRGFKGSFPHFRRASDHRIDLLTFQFDKWGGGFVVEIAVCPPDGIMMAWGEHIPPAKVTAHHVNHRLRLGAKGKGQDHWFRYDGEFQRLHADRFEIVAKDVVPYLDSQAEAWWQHALPSAADG